MYEPYCIGCVPVNCNTCQYRIYEEEDKKMKGEYQHAEAFCLMMYKCDKCGHMEVIWNSRDGGIPYSVGCTECDGKSTPIMREHDVCKPDHKLKIGQRYFGNMTRDEYREFIMSRIVSWHKVTIEEAGRIYDKEYADGFVEGAAVLRVWE